jgi:mannitol 2-dehydrogenase
MLWVREKKRFSKDIEKRFFFLNLVDRITPATTDADRKYVQSHCGIADGWPVVTEPFVQWVIEDSFCNGRPPLELLSSSPYNVLLTEHVEAYECMKMRLLNASHTGMCYIGYLMGYTYIHEIMLDKQIEVYIKQLMDDEVTPTLPPVPGIDLEKYKTTLIERFSNPHIKDTALRVCMDGASKFPKFLVPTIVEQIKRGKNPHYCALAVGAWIRYLGGVDEQNKPITLQDALAVELKLSELAAETKPSAKQILSVKQVFGILSENEQFTESVQQVTKLFYEVGSKETLNQWISQDPNKQ